MLPVGSLRRAKSRAWRTRCNGHVPRAGDPLDLSIFRILENYLEPLAHTEGISYSYMHESNRKMHGMHGRGRLSPLCEKEL